MEADFLPRRATGIASRTLGIGDPPTSGDDTSPAVDQQSTVKPFDVAITFLVHSPHRASDENEQVD